MVRQAQGYHQCKAGTGTMPGKSKALEYSTLNTGTYHGSACTGIVPRHSSQMYDNIVQ